MIELSDAIEAFVRGFSFTRSMTHPYVFERIGGLWLLRDAPRTSGDCRNEEWVAHAMSPAEIDRIVRRNTQRRFAISAICGEGEPDEELRKGFKSLGYRLRTTEALMVHDLRRIPGFEAPGGVALERVTTRDLADRLAKAARSRQMLPEHLSDPSRLRQYVALEGRQLVGWVKSIPVTLEGGTATWCSSMFVVPRYRQRGIARALLCRMLRDDRKAGAKNAVLLASHAGAKVYPLVGYRQMGMLFLFGLVKAAGR